MPSARLAYQEVARQLRDRILTGELSAGARLPTEAELCERFHVGRSTVREALRVLASQRLVTTSRGVGGGSAVAQIEATDLTEMLADAVVLLTRSQRASPGELFEVRELLEVPAARLAALRRSPEQLERLQAAVPGWADGFEVRRLAEVNLAFHEVLLDMADNRMLAALTRPLFAAMEGPPARDGTSQRYWRRVLTEHRAILDAVRSGAPEQAAREMAAHLAHVGETYAVLERRARRRS